jgi:putative tryptophan/tyrosine transport system substrate-binding protein
MRRREFMSLIGSVAVAWPVALKAQSTDRVPVIGILNILGPDDPEGKARIILFEQALQELGWSVGRDLKIENREVGGDVDRIGHYAAELIALKPDAIFSIGSVPTASLQQATHTIPIVFMNVADPVGAGVVQSMAHPGGNFTGFSNFEYSMSGNADNNRHRNDR